MKHVLTYEEAVRLGRPEQAGMTVEIEPFCADELFQRPAPLVKTVSLGGRVIGRHVNIGGHGSQPPVAAATASRSNSKR